MPNYDIIPLATDLLEYTIQRVRAKEPEYRRVQVYVMENGQLVEKQLYEKIKDDGKPHFPKSQTFHLCALMQNCATTILEKCISADGRFFETDYDARLHDLDAVIVSCDTLLQYINLSSKKKYISGDQCHYWAELVRPSSKKPVTGGAPTATAPLHSGRQKPHQDLAKMSQMALQIAEAVRHT